MKLSILSIVFILTICFTTNHVANGMPSFGMQTAGGTRGTLPDSAFILNFRSGKTSLTPTYTSHSVDMSKFPLLANQDVQSRLTQVYLYPGQFYTRHYHPRSSEIIIVTKGVFGVEIVYEGAKPRTVRVDIKEGEATAFPQGLIHQVQCKSGSTCSYYAVFTSADPGSVPVPRG